MSRALNVRPISSLPMSLTKGNTPMFLRTFDTSQQGSLPLFEPQYLGLKYVFRVLDINGSVSDADLRSCAGEADRKLSA